MRRGKFFELLDFPRFAVPNVMDVNAVATARHVQQRLEGKAFLSYGAMWSHIPAFVSGLATDDYIARSFAFYKQEWKNENLRSASRLLNAMFAGRGSWYPAGTATKFILGMWFKPSIKGIWFYEGRAYAVSINARKGQSLSFDDVRFLARGIYELHCIDDPNDPIPLIVDLSKHLTDKERTLRVYPVLPDEAVSLEAFEQSVRQFLDALNLAGIALPPPEIDHIIDLFKR